MTVALVVVLILAVAVGVGVVLADRMLLGLAERNASAHLSPPLGDRTVSVRVHGSPFLTQAVRGRYGDIEVTATDLELGVLAGATLHAHLRNAYLPLRDLLGRRVAELPVEHVHGEVVIP